MISYFPKGAEKEVEELQAQDKAVKLIREASNAGQQITFRWLRSVSARDFSRKSDLGWGTAVLGCTDLLDQYLYTYGLMVHAQWSTLLADYQLPPGPIKLVDHGCGQGLAGLILSEKFGPEFAAALKKIILIEPSKFGLVRSEAVYRAIAPECEIHCVNKQFDDVTRDDFQPGENMFTLHLFSNVLDIAGFDQFQLFGEAFSPGEHEILVVSPDRDFDGGTPRIQALKAAVEDPQHAEALLITHSELREFSCGPNGKFPAVTWRARVAVNDE